MGRLIEIFQKRPHGKKIARVWRLSKKMFPDYKIAVETYDKRGMEISLAKAEELLKGKNAFFCSEHFEMDEPEAFLKEFSWQGKNPCIHYLQPYTADANMLRILSEHAECLSARIFPEDCDWESAKKEYDKILYDSAEVDDVYMDCDLTHFSFKITLSLKDFADDYLRQLEDCGYRIKYY